MFLIINLIGMISCNDKNRVLRIESTERTESLIIPNLSPLDAIAWLSNRAEPAGRNGVNYVLLLRSLLAALK